MCYDISFTTTVELISTYLPEISIEDQIDLDSDTGIHVMAQAHRKYPIILFDDNRYKLKNFEWGVIADYMNSPEKIKKGRSAMCNARSEKIMGDRKSYWHRIRTKRCLIPITGIYEHREVRGWKHKVPYHVRLQGRPLFCIPGLYHYAPIPDLETGEVRGTFTLITRSANEVMQHIHNSGDNANRMPLFLPDQETELKWLLPDLTDAAITEILDYELPAEQLDYWPVYTIRGTKPRPDSKGKTDPYEWANLPALGNNEGLEEKQNLLFK